MRLVCTRHSILFDMGDFKKLQTVSLSRPTTLETTEERYWKKFIPANECGFASKSLSFSGPVTDVVFSPIGNYDFAVTYVFIVF